MDIQKSELHIVPPEILVKAATAALIMLGIWGIASAVKTFKEFRYVGSGTTATNTIVVSGKGDVFAVPDLATFSVSVSEEAKEVKDAQKKATDKMNSIIAYLKSAGVEEKDIKTTSYDVSPKYEWNSRPCIPEQPCYPNGKQQLVGYTVSQALEIKVRDTDKAGDILAGVGSRGASYVSGLSFTVDDDEKLKSDARQKAIDDAEAKASELADQLGVSLVRIVGFSEDGGGPIMYAKREAYAMDAMGSAAAPAPELPKGENKITSNVTITYEIR